MAAKQGAGYFCDRYRNPCHLPGNHADSSGIQYLDQGEAGGRHRAGFHEIRGKRSLLWRGVGSYRGATWMAGVYVFGEQDTVHKLFGVGPDSMYSYLDKDASKRLSRFVFRVFYPLRLINAHNEELTILINQGILGLAAFLLMMGSALIGLLRGKDKYPLAGDGYLYAQMCGICLLAYLANNLFSFEHTISLSAMYIIWGVGLHSFRMNGK